MVVVKLREVYDLSTKRNEMTMIGVHTPRLEYLVRQYNGLFVNCKKFRFVKCDINCACASTLPADPAQIGTDATDIAPQDMFNPILFRAVSNDSFDLMNTRLYSLGYFGASATGGSVDAKDSNLLPAGVDDFGVYYALLSNPNGWRTASPQAGFSMRNLKPLVWQQLFSAQSPFQNASVIQDGEGNSVSIDGPPFANTWTADNTNATSRATSVRGHAQPYPALPTFIQNTSRDYGQDLPTGDILGSASVINGLPDVAKVFVAQIIIPPAKLNLLYYRMVVDWYVEFTGLRPASEIMTLGPMANMGTSGNGFAYFSDYSITASKTADEVVKLGAGESTVDVAKANVELVMQS